MRPPSSSRFICCTSEACGCSAAWLPARRSSGTGPAAVGGASVAAAAAVLPAGADDLMPCLPPVLPPWLLLLLLTPGWERDMRRRSVLEAHSRAARRRSSSSPSCASVQALTGSAAIRQSSWQAPWARWRCSSSHQALPSGGAAGGRGPLGAAIGGGAAGALGPRGGPPPILHRALTSAASN